MIDSAVLPRSVVQAAAPPPLDPASSPAALLQDPRVRAMLDVIAHAEGTNDSYHMLFGGRLVDDLSWHPNSVQTAGGYSSSAAGRYQFLSGTWSEVAGRLGLQDFSPQSQDLAAVQLMKQRGMIAPLLQGDLAGAIHAGAPEWASLPTPAGTSYYDQPVRTLDSLHAVYGGALQRHSDGLPGGVPIYGTEAPVAVPTPRPDPAVPMPTPRPDGAWPGAVADGPRVDQGYTVRSGDTLWDIARAHGLSLGQLLAYPGNAAFNSNPDLIYRGDTVLLPPAQQRTHAVVAGDTLGRIATDNGLTLGALLAANPQLGAAAGRHPDRIFPGDAVRIPGAAGPWASPQAEAPSSSTSPAPPVVGAPTPTPSPQATAIGPYTVYSGGARVSSPDQVRQHHSDADGRRYQGQTLIPRDVVLEAAGESRLSTPVPAPVAGTVVEVGTGVAQHQDGHGGRGNYVILRDDEGRYVRLYHFTDVAVSQGQQVAYGQPLGTQGNTGRSQGAHVHIESDPAIFDRWITDLVAGRFAQAG